MKYIKRLSKSKEDANKESNKHNAKESEITLEQELLHAQREEQRLANELETLKDTYPLDVKRIVSTNINIKVNKKVLVELEELKSELF